MNLKEAIEHAENNYINLAYVEVLCAAAKKQLVCDEERELLRKWGSSAVEDADYRHAQAVKNAMLAEWKAMSKFTIGHVASIDMDKRTITFKQGPAPEEAKKPKRASLEKLELYLRTTHPCPVIDGTNEYEITADILKALREVVIPKLQRIEFGAPCRPLAVSILETLGENPL